MKRGLLLTQVCTLDTDGFVGPLREDINFDKPYLVWKRCLSGAQSFTVEISLRTYMQHCNTAEQPK